MDSESLSDINFTDPIFFTGVIKQASDIEPMFNCLPGLSFLGNKGLIVLILLNKAALFEFVRVSNIRCTSSRIFTAECLLIFYLDSGDRSAHILFHSVPIADLQSLDPTSQLPDTSVSIIFLSSVNTSPFEVIKAIRGPTAKDFEKFITPFSFAKPGTDFHQSLGVSFQSDPSADFYISLIVSIIGSGNLKTGPNSCT
jgi:hypothetical protein